MMRHSDAQRLATWKSAEILSDEPMRAREVILALLLSAIIVVPTWVMIWRHLP